MKDTDDEIIKALEKKALGYDYEEIKIIASKTGKAQRIEKVTKHMPPDARAARALVILRDKLQKKRRDGEQQQIKWEDGNQE